MPDWFIQQTPEARGAIIIGAIILLVASAFIIEAVIDWWEDRTLAGPPEY